MNVAELSHLTMEFNIHVSFWTAKVIQWNLIMTVTLGPNISDCDTKMLIHGFESIRIITSGCNDEVDTI